MLIDIPGGGDHGGPWRITHSLLKLPPVRVLDALIWFDWWVGSRHDRTAKFSKWPTPVMHDEHGITPAGHNAERELLSRLQGAR